MKKKLLLTLCLAPMVIFQMEAAWARPSYLNSAWPTQYPSSTSDDTAQCQLCHQLSTGGEPWNDYGWAIRVNWVNNGEDIDLAIADAAGSDSDSDPTSSTNLTEIQVNTQPGWTPGANNIIHFKDNTFTVGQEPPAELAGVDLDPNLNQVISVSPDSVDFSQVKKGRSADLDVQIANIGLSDLTVSSINLCTTPVTSSEYSWSGISDGTVIGSGNSVTLTVTFSPTNTGLEEGCIEINNDDPDQPVTTVDVSGEGVNKVSGGGGNGGGGNGGGGNGGGGNGGGDSNKVFLSKALTGENMNPNGMAENGETLTHTITLTNTSKNEAVIDVAGTVPLATVHTGAGHFTCADTAEGSPCEALGVAIPGKSKGTNGETVLTFVVQVNTPYIDIDSTVSATGVDCALVENTCAVNTPAEPDTVDPLLTVLNPANGADVVETGFTVHGTASDAGGIASVIVNDGATDHPAAYDSSDDTWTVDLGSYPVGTDVTLTVTATDNSGNQTINPAIVVTVTASSTTEARHLINRISYGITTAQLVDLNNGVFDLTTYRTAQLNPTGCLEPAVAQTPGGIFDGSSNPSATLLTLPIATRNDLQNSVLTHMILPPAF